jgi:hypothetical protein
MPVKLSTTVNKISLIGNSTNVSLIQDFYEYLKNTGASEKHINNNLKAIMNFANHIDPNATFFDINRTEQIVKFLHIHLNSIIKRTYYYSIFTFSLSSGFCCCGAQFSQGFQKVSYHSSVIFGAFLRNSP